MQDDFEKKMESTQEQMRNEKSFAELFDEKSVQQVSLEPGQKVKANIVRITRDGVFINLGGKSEGYLDRKEFEDRDSSLTVQEGDEIEVYFVSARHNEQLFTTKMSGSAIKDNLDEIYRSSIPLEGYVDEEVKGGFQVKITGDTRAFCPYSQMDLRRVENAEEYVGQHLTFKITEYKEGGRNIILSRRILLEEERDKQKEGLKETLQEGSTVTGTITSVRDFGAFIDIGGLEGLIPVSELGWGQIDDIHEIVHPDQEVEVTVLKLDWQNDRFAFSLKGTSLDPWTMAEEKYREGTIHSGRVSRLVNFGAFVTLEPGIDGLLHISQLGMGRRINHPREVAEQGQEIEVRIGSVDMENRRISLSLAHPEQHVEEGELSEESEQEMFEQYTAEKKKTKTSSMGTLGDLLKNKIEKK